MSKAALKSAKAAIDTGDFESAKQHSQKVLSSDPSNYHANVFLGLASFNLSEIKESEEAYRNAIKANKKEPLAWQGLVNLFEKTWQVDQYLETATQLAVIFIEKDERDKCITVVQKMAPFAKQHGNNIQYKKALELQLPDGPLYDYLEGVLPQPAHTCVKLAELIEAEEKETISKEIAKRKSRLGATVSSVTSEVKLEIYKKSPLQGIYQKIINWSHDDNVRRIYETKQIQLGYNTLLVLPAGEKEEQRATVLKWSQGLTILKAHFELAWILCIEWRNCESLGDLDESLLRDFVDIFPDSGLGRILRGFFGSEVSPFPVIEAKEPDDEGGVSLNTEVAPDDRLDYMIEGLYKAKSSILGHRILAEYYLYLQEYENAVETSRKARDLILKESKSIGMNFQVNLDAITVVLATSLVHYQTPKHHPEATTFFNDILQRNPSNSGALIGLGLILEEQGDYNGAANFLNKALEKDPDNYVVLSEASWCEILQGHYEIGQGQLERCLTLIEGTDPRSLELKAQILWRIGSAIWEADIEGRSDRSKGYSYFMQALKTNGNFAPAFTSLGIYYEEIAKDSERASKCYQKAFELSAGEFEAAERLARGFADSREWELVEIVARRAAEADKKRTTPGKAASWPQIALGVVELNAQNYPASIQAFQAALRTSPDDFHSWVGLGEAYTNSGRYTAATKAFKQARVIDESNWFASYMLANVNRELGDFEAACEGYRSVLQIRDNEFGVLLALAETLVADSYYKLENGEYGQAISVAIEAFETAQTIVADRPDAFNLWKLVGDACFVFQWIQDLVPKFPKDLVKDILIKDIDTSEFNVISDVDDIGSGVISKLDELSPLRQVQILGILAYKRGIYASAEDRHAHAVAWFNLGYAEHSLFLVSEQRETKHRLAAVRCFKRSIKLEPGNNEFWNALGVAISDISPAVAQHAFIRSLHIDEKNVRVWTNLGALYMLQEDFELANQAFSRAQSCDPDYTLAWIGQGMVATLLGEVADAQELFEHAFQIGGIYNTIVNRQYTKASFDCIIDKQYKNKEGLSLLSPMFALRKLQQQVKNDIVVLRLAALYDERFGTYSSASEKLEIVCSQVEQRYEETEDEKDLAMFAEAKADLARAYLGEQNYELATENASTALDLSEDLEELKSCRLSAHLTNGLAYYFSGDMEQSLDMFKSALTESSENPDVVALLSQVLWMKGGDEERDVARQQLITCANANPDHLQSGLLLGAMAVVDENSTITQKAKQKISIARTTTGLSKLQLDQIDRLLGALSLIIGEKPLISTIETIFMRPGVSSTWAKLADTADDVYPADMALNLAKTDNHFDANELSKAFEGTGTIEDDLMAIFVAPWRPDAWKLLEEDSKNQEDD